jgi:hypothetical protein
MKTQHRILLSLVGVFVIVGAGYFYVVRMQQPIVREGIEGTIKQINTTDRTAALEIMHPKTNKPIEIQGEVAPDCLILRDGKEITLADLSPGEKIEASGLLYPLSRRIVATRVEVVSNAEPATTPDKADPPADDESGEDTSNAQS